MLRKDDLICGSQDSNDGPYVRFLPSLPGLFHLAPFLQIQPLLNLFNKSTIFQSVAQHVYTHYGRNEIEGSTKRKVQTLSQIKW
jgi:hypothetical protein